MATQENTALQDYINSQIEAAVARVRGQYEEQHARHAADADRELADLRNSLIQEFQARDTQRTQELEQQVADVLSREREAMQREHEEQIEVEVARRMEQQQVVDSGAHGTGPSHERRSPVLLLSSRLPASSSSCPPESSSSRPAPSSSSRPAASRPAPSSSSRPLPASPPPPSSAQSPPSSPKARRLPSSPPPPSSPQSPPASPKARRQPDNRMLRKTTPKDSDGLIAAFYLHIQVLWMLSDSNGIPKAPPAELKEAFETYGFTSRAKVIEASTSSGRPLLSPDKVRVADQFNRKNASSKDAALKLESEHLRYLKGYIARFGLGLWRPDLDETAYSLFNSACRIIALVTFRQLVMYGTYASFKIKIPYLEDYELLMRIFDHYVFCYQLGRYRQEQRTPGSVQAAESRNTISKRRSRLAVRRLQYLKDNHYPAREQALVENSAANSDDEYDRETRTYVARRRLERSISAELWFRVLDRRMQDDAARGTIKLADGIRNRVVPEIRKPSIFAKVASDMPLDYFDPDEFNSFGPATQDRVANPNLLAFVEPHGKPRTVEWMLAPRTHESYTISTEDFFQRFSDDVLPLYALYGDNRSGTPGAPPPPPPPPPPSSKSSRLPLYTLFDDDERDGSTAVGPPTPSSESPRPTEKGKGKNKGKGKARADEVIEVEMEDADDVELLEREPTVADIQMLDSTETEMIRRERADLARDLSMHQV